MIQIGKRFGSESLTNSASLLSTVSAEKMGNTLFSSCCNASVKCDKPFRYSRHECNQRPPRCRVARKIRKIITRITNCQRLMWLMVMPNGLANLRQVSGAKVASASFVMEAARRQAQRFVRRQAPSFVCHAIPLLAVVNNARRCSQEHQWELEIARSRACNQNTRSRLLS